MELCNRKRADRRARTRRIVNQQRVILNRIGLVAEWPSFYAENHPRYQPITDTAKRIGMCRKKKALDCGKTGCHCCQARKTDGHSRIPTRDEEQAELDFREQSRRI